MRREAWVYGRVGVFFDRILRMRYNAPIINQVTRVPLTTGQVWTERHISCISEYLRG